MNKVINPKDLLSACEFVREPVDKLCKKIDSSNSKRIILEGGRGTGRTVFLQNAQNRKIGYENQLIYMRFDSVHMFHPRKDIFEEAFFEHYYELKFSLKIMHFIMDNYRFIYENYFKNIQMLLKDISKKTDYYINNIYYENITIDKYLKIGELSTVILEKLKKQLNIESISLAIDRFDWINGNSILAQETLIKYFGLFDKVIITTDDETLDKNKLKELGYTFTNIDYCKDVLVIKEIIRRRIDSYNLNTIYYKFPKEIITDEMYQNLINKTNGNITLIINTINEIIDMYQWDRNRDWVHEIDIVSEAKLYHNKELKKIMTKPKLYL